jgi:hypothetical protein
LTNVGASELNVEIRRNRRGAFLGIAEVDNPSATWLLRGQLDDVGELLYRFLSAISHGTLYGLMNVTEVVGEGSEGVSFVQPVAHPESVASWAGASALSFFEAFERQMRLYGWHSIEWQSWERESQRSILLLLREAGAEG